MTCAVVYGGRYFRDVGGLWRALDLQHALTPFSLVIDGASDDVTGPYIGADYWGHQWALARRVPTQRFHAEWEKHGRPAGPIRNGVMLDVGQPDIGIEAPGGRGTANMRSLLGGAGVPVFSITSIMQNTLV